MDRAAEAVSPARGMRTVRDCASRNQGNGTAAQARGTELTWRSGVPRSPSRLLLQIAGILTEGLGLG